MDKKELMPEQRGVFLGELNEYSEQLTKIISELQRMKFEFVNNEEALIEKCYTYEPALILTELSIHNINILIGAAQIRKYRHAVSIGVTQMDSGAMQRLVKEFIITDVVVKSEKVRTDAHNVIHAFKSQYRFGVNLRAITERMPLVTDMMWHDIAWERKLLRSSISDKLDRLGVKKELLGHKYLIAAIALQSAVVTVPQPIKLYENIAAYYETTPLAVEKAIRYAIETAWVEGDIEYQHEIFGMTVDEERGKPTNAEFIARLALDF